MRTIDHLKLSPILFFMAFLGSIQGILISIVASLMIDADHLHLIIREKAFSIKKIKNLNAKIYENSSMKKFYVDVTYVFHTIEFNLLLLSMSCLCPLLIYVVAGNIFHVICDIIHHKLHKLPVASWLFLTKYLLRKKTN